MEQEVAAPTFRSSPLHFARLTGLPLNWSRNSSSVSAASSDSAHRGRPDRPAARLNRQYPSLTKLVMRWYIVVKEQRKRGKPMNVSLTPELERLVQDKVQTGRYNSASEVVREALRLMEERDQVKAEIRKKIADGVESIKAGRVIDGEAYFAQVEAELDEEIRSEGTRADVVRNGHK